MHELVRISPFKCRMWSLHDRMSEDVCNASTRQLTESIRLHGQKQAVLGRRIPARPDTGNYEIELIYGARRLCAALELGVDLLVEVHDIDDRSALVAMDIENRVREDISPYERGMSYRRFLRSGMFATQSDLSRALGVSEAQVSRLLRFAELPAVVVSAFSSHRDIREDWAVVLAKLCHSDDHSAGILRRARLMSAMEKKGNPEDVYNGLISDGRQILARSRVRDEIVKSKSGHPLFRIGIRARAIHLILPRVHVTNTALQRIASDVQASLEGLKAEAEES